MTMMDLFNNSYNQIIKLFTRVDHILIFIFIKAHFLPFYIVLCYFVKVCSNYFFLRFKLVLDLPLKTKIFIVFDIWGHIAVQLIKPCDNLLHS